MSVIVVGTQPLPALGVPDCVVLGDVAQARFDNRTETWTLTTSSGECAAAALVVDARPSANPTIADHGMPNYFRVPGPDMRRQARYVARCLRLFERTGAGRIEARKRLTGPSRLRPLGSRFHLTGAEPGPDELFDGPATLTVGGQHVTTRVRLLGHLDPIDGRYHWQGTVFEPLPESASGRATAATLTIEDRTAAARVVEQTPWGTTMIAGVGDPPFRD